jgi:hypothetical protein
MVLDMKTASLSRAVRLLLVLFAVLSPRVARAAAPLDFPPPVPPADREHADMDRRRDAEKSASAAVGNSARDARASDDPWTRPLALDLHAGLGTPLGFYGLTTELTPVRWFTIGVGAGESSSGLQEALMARVRVVVDGTGFALGGGVSTGPYQDTKEGWFCGLYGGDCTLRTWDRAVWGNMELSVEHRLRSGLELRAYFGSALLSNQTADGCVVHLGDAEVSHLPSDTKACNPGDATRDGSAVPYAGVSVGYAFRL